MQPNGSSHQEKLAQLPLEVLLVLLDSDELQVASENTVIAAVSYWLSKNDRHANLEQEDLLKITFRLRLQHSSPTYLRAALDDPKHWLHRAFTLEQREDLQKPPFAAISWCVSKYSISACAHLMTRQFNGLLGSSIPLGKEQKFAWLTREPRPPSSIKTASMQVKALRRDMYMGAHSAPVFYAGCSWEMVVVIPLVHYNPYYDGDRITVRSCFVRMQGWCRQQYPRIPYRGSLAVMRDAFRSGGRDEEFAKQDFNSITASYYDGVQALMMSLEDSILITLWMLNTGRHSVSVANAGNTWMILSLTTEQMLMQ